MGRRHNSEGRRSGIPRGVFRIPGLIELFRARYPSEYEQRFYEKEGSRIFIRPIKPEDAPLLVEFFNSLSPRTIFYRFLRKIDTMPAEWIGRFTCIDHDLDVAMVATEETDAGERILGVCRIMRRPGSTRGEVAVVVGDQWQGRGIGTNLLEISIDIARDLGMQFLWAIASADNEQVLDIAEKLGFSTKTDSASGLCELEMTLTPRS